MTVRDAMVGDYTGFNFIEKGGLQKAFKTIENFDEYWLQIGDKFWDKHFKGVKFWDKHFKGVVLGQAFQRCQVREMEENPN
jgi:hypothetical protein